MPGATLSPSYPAELSGRDRMAYRAARTTALLAGLFCLAISLVLVGQRLQMPSHDPLHAGALATARQALTTRPRDAQLKQQIQELDLMLRERFFRHMSLNRTGGWLLLGGMAVFLLAARQAAAYRKRLPMPLPNPDAAEQAARQVRWSRWALAGTGLVAGASLGALVWGVGTALPSNPEELTKLAGKKTAAASAAADWAPLAELRKNWPRFRGADGNGVATEADVLLTWDVQAGKGVLWKTPVPAPGFGSPIVWGERLFFSGGDATKREVFCLDAATGKLVWRQAVENVPGSPAEPPEVPDFTGYAASTMATDGRRVYAIFANGDLAALDLGGRPVWSKNLGLPKNQYGHATSLLTWEGKVLVQMDQGEGDPPQSKLMALDGRTGAVAWQRPRPVPSSWATPIVIEVSGQPQLITLGVPWVIAYGLTDGTEIWRAECLAGEVTPSPVFAADTLFVISPSEKLLAIRPDGRGDVSQSHMAWTVEEYMSDIPSLVSNGELVFTVTTQGLLRCYDAKQGQLVWEQDYEIEFHASPTLAGTRVYLISKEGRVLVVEAARAFKELARTEMGEGVSASPAFVGKRIFIRGATNLYGIGAPGETVVQAL